MIQQPPPSGGASQGAKVTERSSDEILEAVREIMIDVFDVDDLQITPATTADDIEEWDSLSHVRLLVTVERKFGVKFTNSEIESLKSVGDLVRIIQSKAT
jgi:acyl carrier protein